MAPDIPKHSPAGRAAMIAALFLPGAYPHSPEAVEHIETHISDVFLAGEFAYKVKKPVSLGFCDFSTLELRRHYTFRELDLNRRLSPDVYLGVEEVRRDERSGYSVGGSGRLVEYALKMRRLPAEQEFGALVRQGAVTAAIVRRIARRIAGFHKGAPRAPAGSEFGTPATVRDIVLGNLDRAIEHGARYAGAFTLEDIRGFSLAFLDIHKKLFVQRQRDGFIRECHGDLHAANIFLENQARGGTADAPQSGIQVIDCIEFNDRLRIIDTAADAAFLAMDLERLGRLALSKAFMDGYIAASGDGQARLVLPFYMAYRATVRCMAHGLQRQPEESSAYGQLAAAIAARERPPMLILMSGTTGSGKSTVAKFIAARWGFTHLQTDVVRKRLAGLGPLARTDSGVREGLYAPEMSARTYREMERLAAELLAAGRSVIMDGTFLKRAFRTESASEVRRMLSRSGADPSRLAVVIVECSLPEAVQVARLEARYASGRSESEGRPEVYRAQAVSWQPAKDNEADDVVRLDTSASEQDVARTVLDALWRAALSFRPDAQAAPSVRERLGVLKAP